ncbi:sensor histidine kinase [Flammeovirga aprica]|uniref:sensor histidine kinase n=1 Tax=Flammeovirga aprica TaxID=29528 RepID=UPI00197D98B2|nr:ATP-binding protein [Flammeovirga aprica]
MIKSDTISRYLQFGDNVPHFDQDSSNGISIPLSFKAGETKKIYYSIFDLGFAYNDSFTLVSPEELDQLYDYDKKVRIVCRSIIGIFLFIGLYLGIYFRKKVFFYYFFCSFTGIAFVEGEFSHILHFLPDNVNGKFMQSIYAQLYHCFYFFFYYSLVFNSKGLKPFFNKTMKSYLYLTGINIIFIYVLQQNSTFFSNYNVVVSFTSFMCCYIFIMYLLYKGFQLKIPIVKPVAFIFMVNFFVVIIFSVLTNLGIISKDNLSRYIIYYLFAFDSTYYIFVILYKYYQLTNEKKALLIKYNILQRDYSLALMEGQENEKNKIGRELHDHIGGNLALLNKKDLHFQYNSEDLLQNTINSLEDIIKGLSKESNKEHHFKSELEQLFQPYSKNNFRIHLKLNIKKLQSPYIQRQLYRICQELLTNAIKHSQAKNVYFHFDYISEANAIDLHYADDGIGFNKTSENKGIGLKNMKYRVEKLKGKMEILEVEEETKIDFLHIQLGE